MSTKYAPQKLTASQLAAANQGSFFTILGVGDVDEYIDGYASIFAEREINLPTQWFQTTGESINAYAAEHLGGPIHEDDRFKENLTVLLFPLEGMDIGKLAMVKLQMQDRWFDDIIGNMRAAVSI